MDGRTRVHKGNGEMVINSIGGDIHVLIIPLPEMDGNRYVYIYTDISHIVHLKRNSHFWTRFDWIGWWIHRILYYDKGLLSGLLADANGILNIFVNAILVSVVRHGSISKPILKSTKSLKLLSCKILHHDIWIFRTQRRYQLKVSSIKLFSSPEDFWS